MFWTLYSPVLGPHGTKHCPWPEETLSEQIELSMSIMELIIEVGSVEILWKEWFIME